jgi:V/A-type H+-transporting ATPase subunit K
MATEETMVSLANSPGLIALGAGLAMGLSALAAGWSQSAIGSSAMGLVSERPELESKVLLWIVLPEVLAVLGFLIAALLVLLKM